MKGSIVAATAALLAGAEARVHNRHADAHNLFKRNATEVNDMCTTVIYTITGDYFWHPTPEATDSTVTKTTTATSLTTTYQNATTAVPTTTAAPTTVPATTVVVDTTVIESCTVPTPAVSTVTAPGTYTFPATTVVVTETTTVCGASSTSVPAGTHTLGGVTTVVSASTVVTCPVATTSTLSNGVVTSVLTETTYVCPTPGTYTINPVTTTVTKDTTCVVPVVTSYTPGTYTRPAVVTTITETDIVIVCPFVEPTTSTVVPVVPTTAPAPVTTPAATTPAPEPVKPTTIAAKVSKTSSVAIATSTPKTSLGGGGNQWAITYTPYTQDGQCKDASTVLSDLTEIKGKGFTTIRAYSTDCDTLPNVGSACKSLGLKMIIGVFVDASGCNSPNVAAQIKDIKEWGMWELVELVVVGNEALFQGYCTAEQLKGHIVEVKTIIQEAGANCPVTTTETVNVWENPANSEVLCGAIDVVGCNAHAYFNAETTASEAGKFVAGQLAIVEKICGMTGYVLETGWPSSCNPNGKAVCSADDQAVAISSIKSAIGSKAVFFSFSDDHWKAPGSCNCEQFWGCGQLF